MVHNGIEYGLMAAYAEGLNVFAQADVGSPARAASAETAPLDDIRSYRYELDLAEIAELWRRGSVVGSWLLDLTAPCPARRPRQLDRFGGACPTRAKAAGRCTRRSTKACPRPVLSAALYARFSSRGEGEFADRVLSAMRQEFGGHREKPKAAERDR